MGQSNSIPILHIEQFGHQLTTNDFYSNNFEEHYKKNGDIIYRPHSHDFFLCVLFTKGSGVHEIDFDTYPITPGSVFFLKPGQTHHWQFDTIPKGYIFFHTQEFYELCFLNSNLSRFPFFFTHENPPTVTLNSEELQKIAPLFESIYLEYTRGGLYKYEKLNSLVNLAYIDLTRHYTDRNPNKAVVSKTYIKILEKLQDILEDYFKTEKSPAFYADKLNITTKHLNRVTKSILNKTCSTVIRERVILEAKRLLVHSNSPLSSIGSQLGYAEYPYFSKIFKMSTGQTPFEFRKRY